jgi:hypothetical protein
MVGPLRGAAGISSSGHHRSPSGIYEVLELKVGSAHYRHKNVDDGPPGGARAGDLRMQCLRSPPLGQDNEYLQKPREKCSKNS